MHNQNLLNNYLTNMHCAIKCAGIKINQANHRKTAVKR